MAVAGSNEAEGELDNLKKELEKVELMQKIQQTKLAVALDMTAKGA